jgi:adenine phosphoribosyltransferase
MAIIAGNGYYVGMETFCLTIGSVRRELPIVPVSDALSIASFVMLGDTELVEAAADALVHDPRFPRENIDLLVCPEAKAIPLTHAVAVRLGVNYVVVRKHVKSYMQNPLVEEVSSITTKGKQTLVLDGPDRAVLAGKKVCVIDDVVSTGGSLRSIEQLLEQTGCSVVCKAAALLEEGGYSGEDLVFLARLPVFRKA